MQNWITKPSFLLVLSLFAAATAFVRADDEYTVAERSHWSLRPRGKPVAPRFDSPADRAWIRNPVDAFILAKLAENELRPAPEAERATLVRRLSFDLTGLPPTPAEVETLLNDTSSGADERLVDRLLASPHYGERWGQHWLDVVRFAETEGFEYDRHQPNAWRFRDYVIRSFNEDKSFDRFIREQLAGDEISPDDHEAHVAAGFLRLGPVRRNAGNPDVAFSRNEVLTEMTDTIGVTFLGLTLGCARCHDHKFDPIRQKDYYRLQAFLASTHEHDIPLADAAEQARWKAHTDEVAAEVKKLENDFENAVGPGRKELEAKLKEAEQRLPPPLPVVFTVRDVADKRTPIHVLKRGAEERPEELVGPRVPGVLLAVPVPELSPGTQQPRKVLADWIVSAANPLTARVIANRVWHYHFGRGLVATPNDFGLNGSRPSHPELLDFLANELVASGWRLKSLHRLIVTSATYRMASSISDFGLRISDLKSGPLDFSNPKSEFPNPKSIDPDNRLLWRFPRRRLDAEEIRDAMLAASGRLNLKAGGESVIVPVDPDLVNLLYKPSQWAVTADKTEHDRRSVYLIAKRNLRLPFLEVFDQPALQTSCPRRESSTHAPQALELLNGDLANDLARAFAERLTREAGRDPAKQIDLGFRLVTGRSPLDNEKHAAIQFLATQPLHEFTLALFNLNEFLYVK